MFDVAIIGCGPVGAFAANLLGKSGASVLVIEQEAHLAVLVATGEYSTLEVAELFSVGRSTVYRALERAQRGRESLVQ